MSKCTCEFISLLSLLSHSLLLTFVSRSSHIPSSSPSTLIRHCHATLRWIEQHARRPSTYERYALLSLLCHSCTLTLCHSIALSLCVILSLSECMSFYHSLTLSHSDTLTLYVILSLSLYVILSLSLSLSPSSVCSFTHGCPIPPSPSLFPHAHAGSFSVLSCFHSCMFSYESCVFHALTHAAQGLSMTLCKSWDPRTLQM